MNGANAMFVRNGRSVYVPIFYVGEPAAASDRELTSGVKKSILSGRRPPITFQCPPADRASRGVA